MSEWRDYAGCADADPEVFFPDSHRLGRSDLYAKAREFCARCPVVAECLEDALQGIEWGMRGGLTPDELHSMRRKRQRAVAKVKASTVGAPRCAGDCGRRVISRTRITADTPAPEGHVRHGGKGMCDACYQRLAIRPKKSAVVEQAVAADYARGLTLILAGVHIRDIGHTRLANPQWRDLAFVARVNSILDGGATQAATARAVGVSTQQVQRHVARRKATR